MSIQALSRTTAAGHRWKAYPDYKDSNVEWLGEIPAHWEVTTVKRRASRIQTGSTPPTEVLNYYEDGAVPWFGPGSFGTDLVLSEPIKLIAQSALDAGVARLFTSGSTMIVTIGATIGKVGYIAEAASSNQQITAVTFENTIVCPKFAAYQLKRLEPVLQGIAPSTTLPIFDQNEVGYLPFTVPPLIEQTTIAHFLDRETARIDALVANKERLIELLQEKRGMLITRAVSKGLDPNVPMKDSGVEWLGEIPAHWEVTTVKRRARRIQTGSTPPTEVLHYYEDGTVPWFGPGSFGTDLVLSEPVKLIAHTAVDSGVARMFTAGSTMIVTIGATIGKVGYIEHAASSNQQITAVTFDTRTIHPKFAAYQLKRLEPVLQGIAPSTTLPIFDQNEVGYLPFAIPPVEEQRAIALLLDHQTAKIDALIAKIREGIGKLKEYRTALISAAVTGKIDVREEVSV